MRLFWVWASINRFQMKHLRFRFAHLGILFISFYFYKKSKQVADVQTFLVENTEDLRHANYFSAYRGELNQAFERIKKKTNNKASGPPAILLLNRFALNITLNFICNLKQFDGAVDRLLVIVFDDESQRAIGTSFPELNVIRWKIKPLEEKFSAGQGRYQIFQYFRARLSAFLTSLVDEFWMVQADTIWRRNLFEYIDTNEKQFKRADIIFDREGDFGLLSKMIAGGYFYVRSSTKTRKFFKSVATFLLDYFSTDNNIMGRQCLMQQEFGVKCMFIPYSVMANWRILASGDTAIEQLPVFYQLDGGEKIADKFARMRENNALFVDPSTLPNSLVGSDRNAEASEVKCLGPADEDPKKSDTISISASAVFRTKSTLMKRGNVKISIFVRGIHAMFEWLNQLCPKAQTYILTEIFPFYAYYLFV